MVYSNAAFYTSSTPNHRIDSYWYVNPHVEHINTVGDLLLLSYRSQPEVFKKDRMERENV